MEAAPITPEMAIEATGLNPTDPFAGPLIRQITEQVQRDRDERMRYVSPPGALKLPKLLDQRRIEYAVPDGAFRAHAMFDRIGLWPMPDADMAEGKASRLIELPDVTRKNEEFRRSRSLIVTAGLRALDTLRSHGSDLGHIVYILHVHPWWIPAGKSDSGIEWSVRAVRVGDIFSDEDVERMRREGRIEYVEGPDGLLRVKKDGKLLAPMDAASGEEY